MSWQKALLLNLPILVLAILSLLPIDQVMLWTASVILLALGLLLVMGWQYRELLKIPGHLLLKGNGIVPLVFYGAILLMGLVAAGSLATGASKGIGGPVPVGIWGTVFWVLFLHSWLTYWLNTKRAGTSGKAGLIAFLVLLSLLVYAVTLDMARM